MAARATGWLAAAIAALATGCSHPGSAAGAAPVREKPACAGCHDGGPGLRIAVPALCGTCHGAAHRGEVGRSLAAPASGGGPVAACLTCHDPHQVHR